MRVTNIFDLDKDSDEVNKKYTIFCKKCLDESKSIFNKIKSNNCYKYSHHVNVYLNEVNKVRGILNFFKKNKYVDGNAIGNLTAVFFTQEDNFNNSIFKSYSEDTITCHCELNKKESIKVLNDFNWKCFYFGAAYDEDQTFFFKGISDTHKFKSDFDELVNLVDNNINNYSIVFERVFTIYEELRHICARQ